jgi:hypothetical protein
MADLVGVFDGPNRVKYNEGGPENDGKGKMIEAIVTHVVDQKNLVLAAWKSGVLTHLNDGNPVPERAESDYGPEGGGVTWTH